MKNIIDNGKISNNPSYLINDKIAINANAMVIILILSLRNNKIIEVPKKMKIGIVPPETELIKIFGSRMNNPGAINAIFCVKNFLASK